MHPPQVKVLAELIDKRRQIKSCTDAADGAGQHIVEHEGGDRKLGGCSSERFAHHAVDTPADKHAAALDVHRADGIGEQHDGENEPGRRLADRLLRNAAHVVGRGAEIAKHDGGRSPKRDKGKHDGHRYDKAADLTGLEILRRHGGVTLVSNGSAGSFVMSLSPKA